MLNNITPSNNFINVINIYYIKTDPNYQTSNTILFPAIPSYDVNQTYRIHHFKNKFNTEEDEILTEIVNDTLKKQPDISKINWCEIAKQMNTGKNARQCHDRWLNYLSPSVDNGPWTEEEENLLIQKYNEMGPKWKKISSFFKSRTDTNLKNRWKLMQRRKRKEIKKAIMLNNSNYRTLFHK